MVARQAEHLEDVNEIANVMEAAAVAEEARIGPAADDEKICAGATIRPWPLLTVMHNRALLW